MMANGFTWTLEAEQAAIAVHANEWGEIDAQQHAQGVEHGVERHAQGVEQDAQREESRR